MSHSQNIHPVGKWSNIEAMLWRQGSGACVRLILRDTNANPFDITIHYGGENDARDFVSKLKEAVGKLPEICSECGKEK